MILGSELNSNLASAVYELLAKSTSVSSFETNIVIGIIQSCSE